MNRQTSNFTDKKANIVFIVLLLMLFVGIVISIKVGALEISWSQIYTAIFTNEESVIATVINDIRLPRILVGILTGINLALAGVILQGILRNPLADPGIIGITAGAGLAAMVIMILYPAFIALIPIAAFVGALGASFMIYAMAWNSGFAPLRLILAGVAIAAFFGGFNTVLSIFYPDRVQGTITWFAGGFIGRSWEDLWMILPYTIIGVIGANFAISPLSVLSLGDDMAQTLGLKVEKTRLALLVLSSILAASAVSVAGMLTFVGLIIPHIIRLIVGSDYNHLIPNVILGGAVFIVYTDTFARVVLAPTEIPVGILMSFIGAPFFLYLLKGVGRK